jgi:hypothetical protein
LLILCHRNEYGHPFPDTFILNTTRFYPENNNQSFPSFDQQLLAYNTQYPNVYNYLEQDYPLSVYPPLDNDNAANSLPYGRWAFQQPRQNLPLTTQNLRANDFNLTPNTQFLPNNIKSEVVDDSETISRVAPHSDSGKVSINRTAKQRGDPSCDSSLCYSSSTKYNPRAPWGSKTWNGQHLFSYTPKGQWLRNRCFNKQQLREYMDNCGKDTVFWVQQAPTQCNQRLDVEDRICRWDNCPVGNRTITSGWLRVAFDESPHLTSSGVRDPLKCAGSMHLWCFEQVFDPFEFHLSGRLRPETRGFPSGDKNVTTLEKLTDVGIVREAYQPWFAQRLENFNLHHQFQLSREYRETLSYCLTKHHVDHQTAARQRARSKRNEIKREDERKTIDVHLGNLKMYVALSNKVRESRKVRRLRRMKAERGIVKSPVTNSARSDISSQPWSLADAQLTKSGGQITCTNWYANPSCEAPYTHLSQQRQYSLGRWNSQEASAQRPRRNFGRQSALPQPTAGSEYGLEDMNTFHSPSTPYLNMNSGLPHYFDPLNPAHNTRQSFLQPSLMPRFSPNQLLDSHAGVSNSSYPQRFSESMFNMATQAQLDHPQTLRPLITQFQQPQSFSSMAVSPKIEEEQRLEYPNGNPNSQLEIPQGCDLIEHEQNETNIFSPAGETLQLLLGGSDGTSLVDSHLDNGLSQEEWDFNRFIDPTLLESELETSRCPIEADSEADNIFTAHTLTDADASQPIGLVACPVSPQVTAAAESWDSLGSLMNSVDFGGFSSADISPLFDDFTATNGVDGESRNF